MLVTGHTGFKGAWLALWLERLGARLSGLALPPADEAATFPAMAPWPRLDSHLCDVRDRAELAATVAQVDPEVIFHLAAQSLVRQGYADPVGTYATNVLGTAHLLEAATQAPSLRAVLVVTSDKVYANVGDGRPFREDDPLGGHDPYSASKACTEMVVQAWSPEGGELGPRGVATARAGNVVGGGDRAADRLLSDAWKAVESGGLLRVRNPSSTRPWQFVLEPLWGYLLLAERLASHPEGAPEAVNFGPAPAGCATVSEVVEAVYGLWGAGRWQGDPGDHPHEAPMLRLDSSLAQTALGWHPHLDLATALAWTVEWWRDRSRGNDLRSLALAQIESYENLVRGCADGRTCGPSGPAGEAAKSGPARPSALGGRAAEP